MEVRKIYCDRCGVAIANETEATLIEAIIVGKNEANKNFHSDVACKSCQRKLEKFFNIKKLNGRVCETKPTDA